MKLYYVPPSGYSQKAIIAMREKEAAFTPELVNLMDPEAHAKYKEIYPIGKVPLLVLDDGYLIPESTNIVEYVDQNFQPDWRLIPVEDQEFGRKTRFTDRVIDLYLSNSIGVIFFEGMKPEEQQDQDKIGDAKEKAGILYGYMESGLEGKNWLMGDQFTLADCSAAPALGLARHILPFTDYTLISSYFDRLMSRPAVSQTVNEAEEFFKANFQ